MPRRTSTPSNWIVATMTAAIALLPIASVHAGSATGAATEWTQLANNAELVSLVDEDRQFLKSCIGVEEPVASERETPLSHSFCQHAVAQREPLIVEDAREHAVLKHNPAVEESGAIAYAGVPLIDADGHALGTLCVLDHRPRQWTKHQVELLGDLAASVVSEIALATSA